ncbi:hypothetical protein ABZ342_03430 [Amycolatopsis sp. NPDC005961]|uniref:hypothetical protein n=1 Tax=Amycolatopsis sp. NPDC005961 TaxID=3156720 RepID=UPI003402D93F
MKTVAEIRLMVLVAYAVWAGFALGPIGADWLTAIGLGEWTAVVLAAALGPACVAVGFLFWRFTGKRPARRTAPLLGLAAPVTVLGLSGLVTGSATRGHTFVLVFTAVPLVIFLLVALARWRTVRRTEATSDVT